MPPTGLSPALPPPRPLPTWAAPAATILACALTAGVPAGAIGSIMTALPGGLLAGGIAAAAAAGLAAYAGRARREVGLLVIFLAAIMAGGVDAAVCTGLTALHVLFGAFWGVFLGALQAAVLLPLRTAARSEALDAGEAVLLRAAAWILAAGAPFTLSAEVPGFLLVPALSLAAASVAAAALVLARDLARHRLLARVLRGAEPAWILVDEHTVLPRPARRYVSVARHACRAALAEAKGATFRAPALPEARAALDPGGHLALAVLWRRQVGAAVLGALGLSVWSLGLWQGSQPPPPPPPPEPPARGAAMLGAAPGWVELSERAVELVMSDGAACAVLESGAAACWGESRGRFAGQPSRVFDEPVALVGLGPVKALALGSEHACALDEEGWVSCWGRGAEGQLGDGTSADSQIPVLVLGLPEVESLALSGEASCARAAEGSVWCWGKPFQPDPGCGRVPEPRARRVEGLSEIVELGSHFGGFHARDRGGRVFTLGRHVDWEDLVCHGPHLPRPVPLPGPARRMSHGASGGCLLLDGHGACWDDRRSTFSDLPGLRPVEALDLAADVAVGGEFTCALTASRTVQCWGFCQYARGGKLGTETPIPVPGLDQVTKIAAGESAACALRGDGSVFCWRAPVE